MPTVAGTALLCRISTCAHIASKHRAFAAIMADGRVVTWGNADSGGDSSAVQDQLVSVTAIKASHRLLGHVVHRAYGLKVVRYTYWVAVV